MPFKHNVARRHRLPRARHRVLNWPAYEAGLRRRGDPTPWPDEAALAGWSAPRRGTPGGQARHSDLAIEPVLTLRLVSRLALRQAEAFARSALRLLGLEPRVPGHSTPSRRGRAFASRRRPRVAPGCGGPRHLVPDSTGMQPFGRGGWDAGRHGGRARRRWRRLHLAVDADTGEIAAHVPTEGHADDAAQVPALPGRVDGAIAGMAADGACDGEPTHRAAAARQRDPPPDVAIPPRGSAAPGTDDPAGQSPRDRHVRLIAERGGTGWRKATGHGRRSLVETAVGRHEAVIAPKPRARGLPAQRGEGAPAVAVLNRMIRVAKPISARVA